MIGRNIAISKFCQRYMYDACLKLCFSHSFNNILHANIDHDKQCEITQLLSIQRNLLKLKQIKYQCFVLDNDPNQNNPPNLISIMNRNCIRRIINDLDQKSYRELYLIPTENS